MRNYQSDVFLLGYDDRGNGHIAVSFGNPDTAPNTAVYVPGTGSTLDKANGDMSRAQMLYTSANKENSHSTASIFWLGYDAPGWEVPGPAAQGSADVGAPKLAAFVNSLAANRSTAGHVTVIGHIGGRNFDAGAGSGVKHAHSEYWDAGPSLDNMTNIVIGRPGKVTAMRTVRCTMSRASAVIWGTVPRTPSRR